MELGRAGGLAGIWVGAFPNCQASLDRNIQCPVPLSIQCMCMTPGLSPFYEQPLAFVFPVEDRKIGEKKTDGTIPLHVGPSPIDGWADGWNG